MVELAPAQGASDQAVLPADAGKVAGIEATTGTPGELLKPLVDWVTEVNSALNNSAELQQRLAAGEKVDIHDVMIGAEKAGIGLQLTTQVRNRIIEAYQEIMRMQV
jgi:flagellar hook-basal body complex protein FliE